MTIHARPLAERLAASDDDQLEKLLRARGVRPEVNWQDFFDAAESLLEPASTDRALAALPLERARALTTAVHEGEPWKPEREPPERAPGAHRPSGIETDLALVDEQGIVLEPVAGRIALLDPPPATRSPSPEPSSEASSAKVAELVFTAIGSLADLLLTAQATSLTLIATGAFGAAERRRLSERGMDAAVVDDLRALAVLTGLAHASGRELRVTPAGRSWLAAPFAARWSLLADAFRAALPEGVRDGSGWRPLPDWASAYPWDVSWPPQAENLHRAAQLLGLVGDDGSEPEWARILRREGTADARPLAALLPAEVDRVFLQNDLTAIAPGPLLPEIGNRLRVMTEHEMSAQASSYRFTATSIAHALTEGETESSIIEFLSATSLTGVPQPLSYLVAQTAARHGLVRVSSTSTDTVISSSDAMMLDAIAVDRRLRPLGLVREGEGLVTRVNADAVLWALADARYPAIQIGEDGRPAPSSRTAAAHRTVPAESARPAEPRSYGPLIARLRARQSTDSDAAWLDRELEAAVRARALVVVEVAMPDGSSRELTLEASGLGGGRLRGRDRTADVERTLPVRSIQSVRVVGP